MNRVAGLGRYSAAGHPPPLLWHRAAQRLEALDANGLLLGVRAEERFTDTDFQFAPGDRLLVYSDGLTEAENKAGLSFGENRLPALLLENQSVPAEQFATRLLDEVLHWSTSDSGGGQFDDITFIVVDLN
jgi:sigma-B regulation protein RsbU (phosphoserine phosphatase)